MKKICILDANTLGNDLDLNMYNELGQLTIYQFTSKEEIVERIKDQNIVITNKVILNEENLKFAKNLDLICVTATGVNNIDLKYAKQNSIAVCNVAGYSTNSVVQHTFSMLFYLLEHLPYYDNYVKSGKYVNDKIFTHFERKFYEIKDKTFGIIGLGTIGQKVATIAEAFGANVIYYSTSGKNNNSNYKRVDFDELLETADIISIHAPLNENTKNLIGYQQLEKMKKTSILLNLGRGTIVNEKDLAIALDENIIFKAGIDVLEYEPINEDNPLLKIKNKDKLLITPHIAWASLEARNTCVKEVYNNIKAFYNSEIRNRVEL